MKWSGGISPVWWLFLRTSASQCSFHMCLSVFLILSIIVVILGCGGVVGLVGWVVGVIFFIFFVFVLVFHYPVVYA